MERLDDLREDVKGLRLQLTSQGTTFVPKDVWLQRNEHVTTELRNQGREIGDLRSEVRSRRLPWTQVVTTVTSVIAILLATGLIGK